MKMRATLWLAETEDHDYPTAEYLLNLLFTPSRAKSIVTALRKQPLQPFKTKDILRASRLILLEESNTHVGKAMVRAKKGQKLSPILLVRGEAARGLPLLIADGYHRVCANWHLDEDLDIPRKSADAIAEERAT